MINNMRFRTEQFLKEYSPLILGIQVVAIVLPIDWPTYRLISLIFCVAPGIFYVFLNPKVVFRNPVLLLMILFVAYFSIQHFRGTWPVGTKNFFESLTTASMIIGPTILFSLINPRKKLCSVIILSILMIAAARFLHSLMVFYVNAPFPIARFAGITHPMGCACLAGLIAVLGGAFFLQHGAQIKIRHWFALLCLLVSLLTAFYTHTRIVFLILLCMAALSVIGIKVRLKKTLLLWATTGLCTIIYVVSLIAITPTKQEGCHIRRKGVFTAGKAEQANIRLRFDIWKDNLSRMDTPTKWVIGNGLGRNVFVKEISPTVRGAYYKDDEKGYLILPHSAYLWALYFGGFIGLTLLLVLYATASWQALLCAMTDHYYTPLATLMFGAIWLLANGNSLLTNVGNIYLCFWIPVGLAAGCHTLKKQSGPEQASS